MTSDQKKEIDLLRRLGWAAKDRALHLELRGAKSRYEMTPHQRWALDWADWHFSKALNEYMTGEVDWVHDWFKDMCDILEVDQNGDEGSWSEYIKGPYN